MKLKKQQQPTLTRIKRGIPFYNILEVFFVVVTLKSWEWKKIIPVYLNPEGTAVIA